MLLQQSIEHVSIVYTYNTYLYCIGPCNVFEVIWSTFSYIVLLMFSLNLQAKRDLQMQTQ